MNDYLNLNPENTNASSYLNITESRCNLDNGLKICLQELNENRLKEVLNLTAPVITDFDKVSIKGSNEIISEFKKTIEEKEANVKLFVFLDETEITIEEKQILENIVNELDFEFYLILSPLKEFNLSLRKGELLIKCFDDVDKTKKLLNNIPVSFEYFHALYRGHPHYIKLACTDNECLNRPSKLLDQAEKDFIAIYKQISQFFADDDKRDAFTDKRVANKGMLTQLFLLLRECEKKATHFKGIKTSTEVYNRLPDFENIEQDKLNETLNETFSFVREKLHKYLEEYHEDERSCFKLYPLFVDWALNNKLNGCIAPGIYYNWNSHGIDVSVVCCNDER